MVEDRPSVVTTDQFWISLVGDGVQQSIHAGWAGQRLQLQVLYPQAAVSGSNYLEGGGDDDSHGECQSPQPSSVRASRNGSRNTPMKPGIGPQAEGGWCDGSQPSSVRASRDGSRTNSMDPGIGSQAEGGWHEGSPKISAL